MITIIRRSIALIWRRHLWFQRKMFVMNFLNSLHENVSYTLWSYIVHIPKSTPLGLNFSSSFYICREHNLKTTLLSLVWSLDCIHGIAHHKPYLEYVIYN
jgi:hypothetical protein